MDTETAQQQPLETEKIELNALGKVAAQFLQYGANASNNLSAGFSNMDTKGWIRLIVIVGGYMLLRPYVLKMAGKVAVRKMEEQDEKEKEAKAKISPNELRDGYEEDVQADAEGDGTGADWGQKARVRQRVMLKNMLEAEELRRQEEEDDKDIEEFLVD
ncbi:trafficking PGA2-domain-containing protein [Dactylonectria macrodidyma]|uniref:Trafficking PGA2-domain-containing protein n=1 Tax=Dactylonectria macrodidyma TaxID=307937 RepID=A0A9P9FNA3_9HYPO|nr:trafficking PGA2-domain-containing protein [Dactylonectria macrodidyma]